jgi:hypothetical protein
MLYSYQTSGFLVILQDMRGYKGILEVIAREPYSFAS